MVNTHSTIVAVATTATPAEAATPAPATGAIKTSR